MRRAAFHRVRFGADHPCLPSGPEPAELGWTRLTVWMVAGLVVALVPVLLLSLL